VRGTHNLCGVPMCAGVAAAHERDAIVAGAVISTRPDCVPCTCESAGVHNASCNIQYGVAGVVEAGAERGVGVGELTSVHAPGPKRANSVCAGHDSLASRYITESVKHLCDASDCRGFWEELGCAGRNVADTTSEHQWIGYQIHVDCGLFEEVKVSVTKSDNGLCKFTMFNTKLGTLGRTM
jgi:hypothetical protein